MLLPRHSAFCFINKKIDKLSNKQIDAIESDGQSGQPIWTTTICWINRVIIYKQKQQIGRFDYAHILDPVILNKFNANKGKSYYLKKNSSLNVFINIIFNKYIFLYKRLIIPLYKVSFTLKWWLVHLFIFRVLPSRLF